ncbi:aspartate kinase [Synechococcus elongatus]|uniref:aspartate kinase n=1 Tax=Synechococcus elongatus TaxID=32046 RepID=UPI0030CA92C5
MALIVQKYGGTSVGSVERIKAVAQRITQTVADGNQVVVVVSAMGHSTDELLKLANAISANPSRRELDMLLATGEQVSIALLSMALHEQNCEAISMTGAQVGIITEAHHSRARILEIDPQRLQSQLDAGRVVVVAGFQGIASSDRTALTEITTLGRGGSDTSAVALAAALNADCCEIYTDVPGILTTDPRLVPEAHLLEEITCDEMLELASLGASVLHPRAVEIARNYGVRLVVRSSWTQEPGTGVVAPPRRSDRSLQGLEIGRSVDGIALDTDQAKVALLHVPDRPGIAASLFGEMAQRGVNVDLIIQSIHEGNSNDISFTVSQADLEKAEAGTTQLLTDLGGEQQSEAAVAKVSISGVGIVGRPGIAAQMFSALAQNGINIQMISTSEVKVSCVIAAADQERAIAALQESFEIEEAIASTSAETCTTDLPAVRGVALDRDQARLAILNVPDLPGMAATIFQILADRQISVDMIVQSQRCRIHNGQPCRDIACTLPPADAELAAAALQAFADQHGCSLEIQTEIAKVSIVGSGMVQQPGVAAQMFAALANHGINIHMIATSEIKVSCIVDASQAVEALQTVHAAFDLAGDRRIEVPA